MQRRRVELAFRPASKSLLSVSEPASAGVSEISTLSHYPPTRTLTSGYAPAAQPPFAAAKPRRIAARKSNLAPLRLYYEFRPALPDRYDEVCRSYRHRRLRPDVRRNRVSVSHAHGRDAHQHRQT